MSKINLTIDTDDLMPDYGFDSETGPSGEPGTPLQVLVIDALARQIRGEMNLDREIREAVSERITREVTEQVAALVSEAIAKPFDLTTRWGEVERKAVTVRELIRENVEKWFIEKPTRNGYGTNDRHTLASLVREVARTVMDAELKAEVDRVRKEVGKEIRDKALRAAVDAISPRN